MDKCNDSSLELYVPSNTNPWDLSKIRFIYRRLGFGISNEKAELLLNKTPEELIDQIIVEAKSLPLTSAPVWGFSAVLVSIDLYYKKNSKVSKG